MSELSNQVLLLKQSLLDVENEIKSLEGGKKMSGSRARKSLQNIKNSAHQLRKSIVEYTKSLPIKHRTTKEKVDETADMAIDNIDEDEVVEEKPKAKHDTNSFH